MWEGKREWKRASVTIDCGETVKLVEWILDRLMAACHYPSPLDGIFKVSSPIPLPLKYQLAY